MKKTKAIELLGGNATKAAITMDVSSAAISRWPDVLPPRIAQRVLGVYAGKMLPELGNLLTGKDAVEIGNHGNKVN